MSPRNVLWQLLLKFDFIMTAMTNHNLNVPASFALVNQPSVVWSDALKDTFTLISWWLPYILMGF